MIIVERGNVPAKTVKTGNFKRSKENKSLDISWFAGSQISFQKLAAFPSIKTSNLNNILR